ncbi:hypothetical protein EON63_23825 [archaeon]|nr:MAG: hypothetical protein EON63_23825 [archaeon]
MYAGEDGVQRPPPHLQRVPGHYEELQKPIVSATYITHHTTLTPYITHHTPNSLYIIHHASYITFHTGSTRQA